ncbi:hypothetical protein GCM10027280_18240 [Micromonospora polyrhachis]|uniref:Right handed beta helix domain-containing protein n=1 Tax=Micromonospora polyrhachis TaxID=1282883 RepID=A0A7W7SM03_9ACTN|nr:right-handed parallel beta-helix repeat-containing protein [Micromonospora polyrhachis]MBB4956921.1 hypothetical protein [Micromonospora polyrhachis]
MDRAEGATGGNEPDGSRRALMRGGAFATAGLVGAAGASMLGAPAAAVVVGPWEYIAPGSSIQAAINAGAKAIQLGAGTYPLTAPIVPTPGCTIRGVGQHTRLQASTTMTSMIAIGNGGPVDAVYVGDLVLDCGYGKANVGIDLNIVGTNGFYMWEPDSVCRLDNLWIYEPITTGIHYRGTDTQACVTSRVRVRDAGRYGFLIEAPDNWWTACEATTTTPTPIGAAFHVAGANNFFQGCKAWYSRGYGFHVTGVRNKFVGCEAQDVRLHGWYIEEDMNVFIGCTCDTAAMWDTGGTANSADGFYVTYGDRTSLVGCQAFDRQPEYDNGSKPPIQLRHGFNVPASMVSDGRLVAPTGWSLTGALVNQR